MIPPDKTAITASVNQRITQVKDETNTLKEQVTQAQNQVQPLQDQIAVAEAGVAAYSNTINSMADNRTMMNGNAYQIWSLVPSGVSLTSVDVRDGASIQGEAATEIPIFSYARSLQVSNIYSSVVIQSITLNETDVDGVTVRSYQFAIIAR